MSRPVRSLFAVLSVLAATPALAAAPAASAPYATLAALEARVAAISFRLTTANAGWCPAVQPQLGWLWGDLRLYGERDRAAASTTYRVGDADAPFIAAIAPGSPAAVAGLDVGAPILAINGAPLSAQPGDDPFARITALEIQLAALPPETPIDITTSDNQTVPVVPVAGCASDFRVEDRKQVAGAADGRLVLTNAGLAGFAADDNELAAAVAHELAHNILQHRARLDAAGVDRGLGKQFGRSARLFRQTEVEADRLSVWLMHGAGYDIDAAVRFWRAYGKQGGPVLFQAGTHPRWQARVASVEAEIAAIRSAQAAGTPLTPPLIGAPPPLE